MHVLFASLGSHGHTYPLLPLARAVRDRGDRVTYATAVGFHPTLTALGFDTATAGTDMRTAFGTAARELGVPQEALAARDESVTGELISHVFATLLPRLLARDLAPVLDRDRPDLVVYEAAAAGAGIAAKAAGLPVACHGFGRGGFTEPLPGLVERFTAVAAEFGVDLAARSGFDLGDPYLDIYPESLQDADFLARADRVPLRPVPFAEPGALPGWVPAHREPLVYLTLGTAFGSVDVLRTAIAGLGRLPVRVLVAAGPVVQVADLGEVPDRVTVLPWVPQAELLPHTDLVVHHGGSGTTLGSAAAGVPQLFLPQGADQFTNADAVTGAGAGAKLEGPAATAEAIAEHAAHLLSDPAAATAAKAVAAEIAAMPPPAEIAARLPELAR